MALRIGLLRRSALQNDGRIKPVILQCRNPQETVHLGATLVFIHSLFMLPDDMVDGGAFLLDSCCEAETTKLSCSGVSGICHGKFH